MESLLVQELLIPTYALQLATVTHAICAVHICPSGSIESPGVYSMCHVIIKSAIETINLHAAEHSL